MALARRSFLFSALAFSTLMASGCGWHLRGHVTLPFDTLYVNMPVNNKVAADIRRMIAASTNVKVLPEAEGAQAILELLSSGRHREVVSLNMEGEAREYELTLNMTFRLVDPDGNEFFPITTSESKSALIVEPALTSVAQPLSQMGEVAARWLSTPHPSHRSSFREVV